MPSEKKTKSFLLFVDRKKELEKMSNEQVGRLIRAIFDYIDSGAIPTFDDPEIDFMFGALKPRIDTNIEKYEKKVERRKRH